MLESKSYRIIKCESNRFIIDMDGAFIPCTARKKVKGISQDIPEDMLISAGVRRKLQGIVAGDFCYVSNLDGEYVLERIEPRANFLLRPNVANIDNLIIVLAPLPKPDFLLIDKLIINAHYQKIPVYLCLNKSDLAHDTIKSLLAQYDHIVDGIISTSAYCDEIEQLKAILCGKLSALAGQSAVGKSTLVNALLGNARQKIGELSTGTMRGKNTTTSSEIIVIAKDTYIIDTPGFSMLDIHSIDHTNLSLYYDEYVSIAKDCKFNMCTHTSEPECAVKKKLQSCELDLQRYERYVIIYNELKNRRKY